MSKRERDREARERMYAGYKVHQ